MIQNTKKWVNDGKYVWPMYKLISCQKDSLETFCKYTILLHPCGVSMLHFDFVERRRRRNKKAKLFVAQNIQQPNIFQSKTKQKSLNSSLPLLHFPLQHRLTNSFRPVIFLTTTVYWFKSYNQTKIRFKRKQSNQSNSRFLSLNFSQEGIFEFKIFSRSRICYPIVSSQASFQYSCYIWSNFKVFIKSPISFGKGSDFYTF